ncbi:MAG: hypothetical protein RLO52_46885 [Sandaracinaceae bacterium]
MQHLWPRGPLEEAGQRLQPLVGVPVPRGPLVEDVAAPRENPGAWAPSASMRAIIASMRARRSSMRSRRGSELCSEERVGATFLVKLTAPTYAPV